MIRYGIVGFGRHAVKRLLPGFALAKHSRVTALSRRDISRARQSSSEHGIQLAFDSVEALCKSPEVDAVFVTSPNSAHLRDVLTAVRAGKPVLCEKPMAMNADECRAMIAAARSANVLLGVAHCFRFEDSVNWIRDRVASGKIGRPVLARSDFGFWGVGHVRDWMNDPAIAGGGPIYDIGVHCIDTLRYILGDEVVSVAAIAQSDRDSDGVEASAVLSLRFSQGTLAQIASSFRTPYRSPIEIVGTEGEIRAINGLTVDHPITIELTREGKVVETAQLSNDMTYARQVDAFSIAVETGRTFQIPGEEGLRNQLVIDAAYSSIRTGKTESVGD
jgi:1,5-anhydro-D-fructose reductase (1,5-anhydro-D-mannitol-forming)